MKGKKLTKAKIRQAAGQNTSGLRIAPAGPAPAPPTGSRVAGVLRGVRRG